jgi:hypothetical protein
MATLDEAEDARRHNSDQLVQCGAHAIGVEPGEQFGVDGYVVVAYAEPGKDVTVPTTLKVTSTDTEVPVVVQRGEMFRPETL